MDKPFVIQNIRQALETKAFPTITYWNRLEGRPRAANFDRALRAEVRDALWMLCKQWQMGEFQGDDAGSPVQAKVQLAHSGIEKYQAAANPAQAFDYGIPLEAQVEQRPIPWQTGRQKIALDLRLLLGRRWLRLLEKHRSTHPAFGDHVAEFLRIFSIEAPDPAEEQEALAVAHRESWQQFAAVAGRCMDGGAWYQRLRQEAEPNWFNGLNLPALDLPDLMDLARKFRDWASGQFLEPADPQDNAWKPEYLEYQCACSTPTATGEKVLTAEEYYHGRLDWYNFDLDLSQTHLGENPIPKDPTTLTRSFLPAPISFNGMPNTRWWTFEDGKTNFGDIKPDTTDLAKLLLIEFGLVYANDWFLLPYTLPAGSIAQVRGLAVTNVFGERFWIEASGRGDDEAWQRWNMFTLNIKGKQSQEADTSLLILPTVPKIQESKPWEEILLVRDEVANMVWGVETVIPLPSGGGKSGKDAAADMRNFFQRLYGSTPTEAPPANAPIRYQAMNSVPENWIPFIPVHIKTNGGLASQRQIRLQRSSMLRILPGMTPPYAKVKPRTTLLREGLDQSAPLPYFINEEEVPRAGVKLSLSFQRTRWTNGKVVLWLGVRKQTGRGEGSSGLAFDRINPVDFKQEPL